MFRSLAAISAIASTVLAQNSCVLPRLPPPAPIGAVTLADGATGHQGYAGVSASFGPGIDLGWRYQPNRWVAVDVQSTVGILYPFVISPGVWFTATQATTRPRHTFAARLGGTLGAGDLWNAYSFGANLSVGVDTRLRYAFRWSPRGVVHLTGQYGYAQLFAPDAPTCGHTLTGSLGVDIPAGPVAVVVGFTGGKTFSTVEDVGYTHLTGQVGIRFGAPSATSVPERRKALGDGR